MCKVFFLHFLKLFFPSQTETGAQILRLRSPFQVKLQVLLDINGIDISVWNLFPSIGGTTAAPRQMLAALNTEYKVKITKYHHLARSGMFTIKPRMGFPHLITLTLDCDIRNNQMGLRMTNT